MPNTKTGHSHSAPSKAPATANGSITHIITKHQQQQQQNNNRNVHTLAMRTILKHYTTSLLLSIAIGNVHQTLATHLLRPDRRRHLEDDTPLGIGYTLLIVALCSILLVASLFYCCLYCDLNCTKLRNRSVIPSSAYMSGTQQQNRSPTGYRPRPEQREIELVQQVPRMSSQSSEDSADGPAQRYAVH
jgi:hypothetical protein